jgi:glutaminase
VTVFETLDAALERVENEILASHKPSSGEAGFSLSQVAMFRGLDAEEMRLLTLAVAPKHATFESGQVIIRKGELGMTFFVVVRGSVSVELPSIESDGTTVQIASLGSGLTFGELALIGRPRGAQVVAESDVVCYAISVEALRAFGRDHPTICVKLLMNIITDLADTLRFANETIRALER